MLLSRLVQIYNTQLAPFLSGLVRRQRHYWKNMDCAVLQPPAVVRGMQVLIRDDFKKTVEVPCLRVEEQKLQRVLPLVKKLLLKMERLRPIRCCATAEGAAALKEILLHPQPVQNWESLPTDKLEELQVDKTVFCSTVLELTYDNWRADEILKSVLPADKEGLTSYSRIGHIVHVNLREHLLPYKQLIGEVLGDKVSACETVVNKAATIDNTYRNFNMELIWGKPEYQVQTKENGVTFEFDFSRVYWNPRLSTEHERLVQLLRPGDVLYDVFAGVGPFSVPAAKKHCFVLANDLNPESYRWLQHNCQRNKCLAQAQLFKKDGRDFLLQDVKPDLLKRWLKDVETPPTTNVPYKMHIAMNLPALAVEFLDVFRGMFQQESAAVSFSRPNFNYPIVHVYCFLKGEQSNELVQALAEEHLGLPLSRDRVEINFVRNVAPNKDMYRVSFPLTEQILTTPKGDTQSTHREPEVCSRKRPAEDADTERTLNKCEKVSSS